MEILDDQVEELKLICPGARLVTEGGVSYVYLPDLQLPTGCSPERLDALLCPTNAHGYPSRLFFAQSFASPASRNWTPGSTFILQRH